MWKASTTAQSPWVGRAVSGALVELRRDASAASRRLAGSLDNQIVSRDIDAHAAGGEPRRDRGEAVTFLDAQFGEAAHDRAAACVGGGDGEDRIFVDH